MISFNQLNKVKDISYNKETGVIIDIPLLIFNNTTRCFTLKKIIKNTQTIKSRPSNKQCKNVKCETSDNNV
jgi:hypothetical protein